MNMCSLNKNFHVLQYPLSFTNKNSDIIAITETKLQKIFPQLTIYASKVILLNLSLTSIGDTLSYVAKHL